MYGHFAYGTRCGGPSQKTRNTLSVCVEHIPTLGDNVCSGEQRRIGPRASMKIAAQVREMAILPAPGTLDGTMRRLSIVCLIGLGACVNADGSVAQTHEGVLQDTDQTLDTADGSFYDDYAFETNAGNRIVVTLQSVEFDPYLHLFDAHRTQLVYNDDAAPGQNGSRIEYIAPYTGRYYVLVNSRDAGEMGRYRLSIESRPSR